MSGTAPRVSLVWLWLIELVALIAAALLYVLQVVPEGSFFYLIAIAVVTGVILYVLANLVAGGSRTTRPEGPKFEMTRADEIDVKTDEYMRMGRQLLREERYDEAGKMFQEVLARNARSWQAHNYLGRSHSCQGRYEEARNAYERALSLEYNYGSAHFNLATAYEKLGEFDAALDRWRQYIEVGLAIGERDDMLEHARQRILSIQEEQARRGGRDDDDFDPPRRDF